MQAQQIVLLLRLRWSFSVFSFPQDERFDFFVKRKTNFLRKIEELILLFLFNFFKWKFAIYHFAAEWNEDTWTWKIATHYYLRCDLFIVARSSISAGMRSINDDRISRSRSVSMAIRSRENPVDETSRSDVSSRVNSTGDGVQLVRGYRGHYSTLDTVCSILRFYLFIPIFPEYSVRIQIW